MGTIREQKRHEARIEVPSAAALVGEVAPRELLRSLERGQKFARLTGLVAAVSIEERLPGISDESSLF